MTWIVSGITGYAAPPKTLAGWEQVFADEFEQDSLDLSLWNPTYNWGHTHNHRAYCVAENVEIHDGVLRLIGEARRHPDAPETTTSGGKTHSLDYTSAAIDTRGKFSVQHGYIEGRFRAPRQSGTWPAFWMLQDGWPPEIDILEIPHQRTQHHYYLHYTDPSYYAEHGSAWDHEASFGGVHSGPDKSAAFHNYGVDWNPQSMTFYFDDKVVATYNRSSEISQTQAMYLIVNLAIGGWATETGMSIEIDKDQPAWFEADWIRVWKAKPADFDSVRIMNVASGLCIQPQEKAAVVGNCRDSASWLQLQSLGGNRYRANHGDLVLEIPNEAKDAGLQAGFWGWNNKGHQHLILEVQEGYTGLVVRMRMEHSNLYLRRKDSLVIQDWDDSWEWQQVWKIIQSDSELPEDPTPLSSREPAAFVSHIRQQGAYLQIEWNAVTPSVSTHLQLMDFQGRVVREALGSGQDGTQTWTLHGVSAGLYYVVLTQGSQRQVHPVVWGTAF